VVEPVKAKPFTQASEKFCEVCALKFASFSLSQNCSALFFGSGVTDRGRGCAPPPWQAKCKKWAPC